MRPSFETGAKMALRAPMTTSTSPRRRRCHIAWRSLAVRPECRTATSSPKRARKRATSCGVSAISGTSTMVPRPLARAAAMACRYTSVLPEPVTPWSRKSFASPAAIAPSMPTPASFCGPVSSGGASRSTIVEKNGSVSAGFSTTRTQPASARRFTVARADDHSPSSRASGTEPSARTRESSAACLAVSLSGALPASASTHCTCRAPTPEGLSKSVRSFIACASSRSRGGSASRSTSPSGAR